jgi:hypothetical protein
VCGVSVCHLVSGVWYLVPTGPRTRRGGGGVQVQVQVPLEYAYQHIEHQYQYQRQRLHMHNTQHKIHDTTADAHVCVSVSYLERKSWALGSVLNRLASGLLLMYV